MCTREKWIDDIKILACMLVALGHFFQSMILTDILPETLLYSWFISTIYYFHVPLFFLCSGYLHQRAAERGSVRSRKEIVFRKGITLGVPYVVFTFATWILKEVFSGSVNIQNAGLLETLVISPISPYWYLYTLFFAFAIVSPFRNGIVAAGVGCTAVLLKCFCAIGLIKADVFIADSLMNNLIWFVLGMLLRFFSRADRIISRKKLWAGVAMFVLFLAVSALITLQNIQWRILPVMMGVWGCFAVVWMAQNWHPGEKVRRVLDVLAQYTMPVFLMHTIFAAGFRAVLMKLRIVHPLIHVVVGVFASFACPAVAVMVMKRLKLDVLLYPNKYFFKSRIRSIIMPKKLNGTVIVTYRCNARCNMCNRYKEPSRPEEEISLETIRKLPQMYFTNITGGEPFIREDLKDIVRELYKKSDRIVISTNGFFTDRIVDLCKEFPNIGIRISIEGLEQTNNEIRGLEDGFNRGYTTLKTLREMGMKDVGFGMTVQDRNAPDLVALYKISDEMGMEFATASLHNSFYFVESRNIIHDRPMVAERFEALVNELLKSKSPKKWMRAYFNHGLINYIYGQKRLLPCDMSFDTFFIDPYGDVMPCNGTKNKEVMGNLNTQSWEELWNSEAAEAVRKKVRSCDRQCWMIGSVSPAMHKYIWKPGFWVVWHKVKSLFMKRPYSMYENKIVRHFRDGKVTKEELDRCSTCELECSEGRH